jgi:hypothetical protein
VADGFQLVSYAFSEMHRDSVKIDLNYQATSPSLYKHFGNDILMGNMAFLLPGFEKPANRKLPVQLDCPIYKVDTLVYEIPVGYELNSIQKAYSISNKYGEYALNIHEKDDKVMVTKSLILYAGMYPVAEYAQFYDFYNSIVEIESRTHLSLSKYDEHD